MRKVRAVVIVAAAAWCVFSAADAAFAQNDIIETRLHGGGTQTVKNARITKETWKTITYKVGVSTQFEAAEDVLKIVHGNPPLQFSRAESARNDGKWSIAIERYESAAKRHPKKWVEKYSRFYIAECYREWGRSDPAKTTEAIKAYELYLSKFSDHRFVPNAHYGKALAAEAARNAAKARGSYKELSGGKYGERWGLLGEFGVGKISRDIGILKRVKDKAKRLGMRDIEAAATLFLAEALKQSKPKEAMKLYDEIVRNTTQVGKEVLATAHNGLGDCYLKLGASQQDQKKALYEYLKVVVLYAGVRNQYIYALKKAIRVLEKIGGYDKRVAVLRGELARAEKEK